MKWVNRALSIALLASVVLLWWQTDAFPAAAATFPRVALAVIALLAAILLAASFSPTYTTGIEGGEGTGNAVTMLKPVTIFSFVLVSIYVIQFIGFFPAMLVVSAALYIPLGVSRPTVYALSVVLLLAAVYVIFVKLLGVPLSGGRLWQN